MSPNLIAALASVAATAALFAGSAEPESQKQLRPPCDRVQSDRDQHDLTSLVAERLSSGLEAQGCEVLRQGPFVTVLLPQGELIFALPASADDWSTALSVYLNGVALYEGGVVLANPTANGDLGEPSPIDCIFLALDIFGTSIQVCGLRFGEGTTNYFECLAEEVLGLAENIISCLFDKGCDAPITYCSAKASSAGCVAIIATSSLCAPVFSGADDVAVTAYQVQEGKNGLLFAGITGPANIPFSGGTLCVEPPNKRGPIRFSGGDNPNGCGGVFATIVNDGQVIPAGLDAGSGNTGWYQYWYRDPQNGAGDLGTALSNAVQLFFL